MMTEHDVPCAALMVLEAQVDDLARWQEKQNGNVQRTADKMEELAKTVVEIKQMIATHLAFHLGGEKATERDQAQGARQHSDWYSETSLKMYTVQIVLAIITLSAGWKLHG